MRINRALVVLLGFAVTASMLLALASCDKKPGNVSSRIVSSNQDVSDPDQLVSSDPEISEGSSEADESGSSGESGISRQQPTDSEASSVPSVPASSSASSKVTPVPTTMAYRIPPFSNTVSYMANTDYKIDLLNKGKWESVTPYNVRVNPNLTQNIKIDDPVQNSPMAYFGMSSSSVTVRIRKNNEAIGSAVVHPKSYGIPAQIIDGAAVIVLDKPQNICVEINGGRYEMVYLFAHDIADEKIDVTDKVKVIPAGLTTTPRIGTETWDGGISDVRIYDRVLSIAEIESLKNDGNVTGYTDRWLFNNNMKNDGDPSVGGSTFGTPKIVQGYKGRTGGSFVFNGYEDAYYSSKLFKVNSSEYTVSAWAYLEPEGAGACRIILSNFIFVRSDGTMGSNIGDWQFPYLSDNKFTAGQWHHVVLTKKNNDVTIYIDAQSGGTKTRPSQVQSVYFGVGSGTLVNGIYVKDGETLYLSPGAVLRGSVLIYDSKNVSVKGSGIIDVTPKAGSMSYSGIVCAYSDTVSVEGVTVNNPSSFNFTMGESRNINIRNFKCFSSYGASDGLNMKASSNIDIDGCFVRANDDAVSIYATSVGYLGSTSNITVKNTSLTSDAGHAVHSGTHAQEYGNDVISDILFDNIDVIDSKSNYVEYQGVLSLNAGNDAVLRDYLFNNIRIQDIRINQLFNVRVIYNQGYNKTPGKLIENIEFRNITYNGSHSLPSVLTGYNSLRTVKDIIFNNIILNGRKLKSGDADLKINKYVYDVVVK